MYKVVLFTVHILTVHIFRLTWWWRTYLMVSPPPLIKGCVQSFEKLDAVVLWPWKGVKLICPN